MSVRTNSEDRQDHLMTTVTANTDEERRKARRCVASHARDKADAKRLLDMMGLLDGAR